MGGRISGVKERLFGEKSRVKSRERGGGIATINDQQINLSTNYQRLVHQRITNSNKQRLFVELRVGADGDEEESIGCDG